MPPGPAFNWLCVAQSAVEILNNAARIRAAQLEKSAAPILKRGSVQVNKRKKVTKEEEPINSPYLRLKNRPQPDVQLTAHQTVHNEPVPAEGELRTPEAVFKVIDTTATLSDAEAPSRLNSSTVHANPATTPQASIILETAEAPVVFADEAKVAPAFQTSHLSELQDSQTGQLEAQNDALLDFADQEQTPVPEPRASEVLPARKLQSSKVPSSRIGRLFHYGGLAASLGYGAASELLRRTTQDSDDHQTSLMMTESNIRRLVSKLTQMRGAALKLGQFMSIQDTHVLPPELDDIFRRVQDSAHYMPDWQMEEVMRRSLGSEWAENFDSFDRIPFAAASIGQVHAAVLAPQVSPTGKAEHVAVKIQFPNILNSIDSDLGYVKLLLTAGKLLPKGLFLDRTIQVMKEELADECNYSREASFLRRFNEPDFLGNDPRFKVPWVWEMSTEHVLVMEHVGGVSVGGNVIETLSQRDRNDIASRIIELCLRELFTFRVMQTDPNWTNFLWNAKSRQIELVDFGATREYSKEFIDNWLRLLTAATVDDKEECIKWSHKVGYLTGEESDLMLDAHVKSLTLLATPFKATTKQPHGFGVGSNWSAITAEIREHIPVMLQHRLTPPPRETYSLNRKLSGAFLLASRLNADVDCRALWENVVRGYQFDSTT